MNRVHFLLSSKRRRYGFAYLMVAPYALMLIVFGVAPGIYALLVSFADFHGGVPNLFQAGLQNYAIVFHDFRLITAFINIGKYLLISLPLVMLGTLLLVLLLHSRPSRFSSSFLAVYFAPGAIAGPTAVLLAIFMFDPNVSPFRFLLHALGFELVTDTIRLANLPFIFAILTFFLKAGAWIAILYGALNNLSREVIEAARVDGCNMWQLAWYIKLPLIFPYIIYMLILVLVSNVQLFAEPQLINSATTSVNTRYWAPNQLAYAFAFESANFGAAAVVSIIMVLIGLTGTVLILSLTNIFRTE